VPTDPQPGEVWFAELGMVEKSRPVIVLAYPQPADARALVVVAPLTSQIRGFNRGHQREDICNRSGSPRACKWALGPTFPTSSMSPQKRSLKRRRFCRCVNSEDTCTNAQFTRSPFDVLQAQANHFTRPQTEPRQQ
jgi:hypothetical protein